MAMWECSECQVENDLDPAVEEGQIVECTECGAEFEVTKLEPLDLELLESSAADDDDMGADDDDEAWSSDD